MRYKQSPRALALSCGNSPSVPLAVLTFFRNRRLGGGGGGGANKIALFLFLDLFFHLQPASISCRLVPSIPKAQKQPICKVRVKNSHNNRSSCLYTVVIYCSNCCSFCSSALHSSASLCFAKQELPSAIRKYSEAVRFDPTFFDAYEGTCVLNKHSRGKVKSDYVIVFCLNSHGLLANTSIEVPLHSTSVPCCF